MSVSRIGGLSIITAEPGEKSKTPVTVKSDDPAKLTTNSTTDSLKTSRPKTKGIPISIFGNTKFSEKTDNKTETKTSVVNTNTNDDKSVRPKVAPDVQKRFNDLYSKLNTSFKARYSGAEADTAMKIVNDPELMKAANDIQKTEILKVLVYQSSEVKDNTVQQKQVDQSINKIVNDFKDRGKINKLVEFAQISLSGTGTFLTGMDDLEVTKIVKNETILSASNPSQKADMLYRLKFGYTDKVDEAGINKILKNAVDNGQLKSLMGYWSDGLDMTSSKMDSLYNNISGQDKTEFLKIIREGMKKENIKPEVMEELYHGTKVLQDIDKLNKAEKAEQSGKYEDASKLYLAVGNLDKSKEMLENEGYKNYTKGNYLSLAKNFVIHSQLEIKEGIDKLEDKFGDMHGTHLTRTLTTYAADKMDNAFKNHPILQAKNVLVLKEEREKNLERLNNIVIPKMTPEQKIASNQKFEQKIDELTGTKSYPGNKMQMLINGEQAFDRLKTRIDNAKDSIYLEAFLFHDDKKGNEIADALIKKANEGLDVRVIIDGTMNSASVKVINKLKNSKVKFLKNKGSYSAPIENRGMSAYHRKLYIIDKKAAMTGGINVGDEYMTKGKWHDMLVEVQGPALSDTLNDFYKHWNYSSGGDESTLEKAPPPSAFKNIQDDLNLPTEGSGKVRLITTDPVDKKKNIKTWMHEAIQNAKERIYIQDPYFNDPSIVQDLKDAINRGVKVEVIFPNSNDVPIMKHLDDNVTDELYAAGASVYMYNTSGKESFNHLKATLVDDKVALGSSNKDVRAMNTNQEINYVFDDKKFAETFIKRVWEPDRQNSTPANLAPETFVKRLIKLGLSKAPSFF